MTYRTPHFAIMLAALAVASAALLTFPLPIEAALQRTDRGHWESGVVTDTTFTTTSFTPSNNSLLVAVIGIHDGDGQISSRTITVSGGGLSWTPREFRLKSDDFQTVQIWTAPVTTGASMTIQVGTLVTESNEFMVHAFDYTGYDASSPIGATIDAQFTANGGPESMTLSGSPLSTSEVVAATVVDDGQASVTEGTGWAPRYEFYHSADNMGMQSQTRTDSNSTTVLWDDIDTGFGAVGAAIEIRASQTMTLSKPPNNLGLVGYWSFNEGTSTKATDFSGNRNHGTLNTFSNPPSVSSGWANGKRGNALQFDGGSDYISIPDTNGSLDLTTTATISFWMKPDSVGDENDILGKGRAATDEKNFYVFKSFDEIVFGFIAGGITREEATSNANLVAGEWAYMTVTYNDSSNSIIWYKNGVPLSDDGGASSFSLETNNRNFTIGNTIEDLAGAFLDATLDEVRIYNRELGASEITRLYQSGAVKFTTSSVELQKGSTLANGLLGHWTFDGPDTQSVIADRSGQGNHGYFIGGATSSAKTIGKLGQALDFDGADDYVGISNSVIAGDSSDMTIAAWVRWDGSPVNEHSTVTQSDATNFNFEFFITADGSAFEFGQNAVGGVTSNGNVPQSTWTHLVVTRVDSSDAVVLYKNGVQDNTGSLNMTNQTDRNLVIGSQRSGGPNQFNGQIDDVRIYNRALTAAEVKQLYNLGRGTIRP